jgi:hypothetical protein
MSNKKSFTRRKVWFPNGRMAVTDGKMMISN